MPLGTPMPSPRAGFERAVSGKSNHLEDLHPQRDKSSLQSEFLVEAAEIENRLRRHVLELIEPTVQKQKQLDIKLKHVKASADTLVTDVTEIKRVTDGQESLRSQIEAFRAELAAWDDQRRDHEQQVGARTSLLDIEVNDLKKALERKGADIASANRMMKGFTEGVNEVREELSALRLTCNERLDLGRDKVAKLRDEFEMRTMAVESEQHRVKDVLIGIDIAVSHANAELSRMSETIGEIQEDVLSLVREKVSVKCVEQQQEEFSEFARRVDARVNGLGAQFGNLVTDIKAHFQTAGQTVVQNTAKEMESMRAKYKQESSRVDDMIKEVSGFLTRQEHVEQGLNQRLEDLSASVRAEGEAMRAGVLEQLKRRDKDTMDMVLEVKMLKKSFKDFEASVRKDKGGGGGGAIGKDVLSMIVESSLMSAAIDLKDDLDRKSIALVGYKPPVSAIDTTLSPSLNSGKACALPELGANGWQSVCGTTPRFKPTMSTPRKRMVLESEDGARSRPGAEPVVTLDMRCLSCSGSQATVLGGFKMACLQYAPSPVEYGKVTYNRSELIQLRMDLLSQVREQLRQAE